MVYYEESWFNYYEEELLLIFECMVRSLPSERPNSCAIW